MIVAVVLAAGRSQRMGSPNKLLARNQAGDVLIHRTAAAIRASAVDEVLVVVGHEAEAIRAAVNTVDVRCVFCPDYAAGMAESLRTGIAALPGSTRAVLICLGDMPLIGPMLIDQILAARCGGDIVLPVYAGARGHPVLWDHLFFAEMMALTGDCGARSLLRRHADYVREVAVNDPAAIYDVDTMEDLAGLPFGPWHAARVDDR